MTDEEKVLAKIEALFFSPLLELMQREFMATYGGPAWPSGTMCEICNGFIPTGQTCKRCPPEGMTKCPANSTGCISVMSNAEKCVLCKGTGFVEMINE